MKALVFAYVVLSCVFASRGETFQMDRKGETTVEVKKSAGEYKVTCRFKPQTKFDKAINAKFNDAKGDSLCKKGLARFLDVATNETLTVAGLYSVAPVKTEGGRLCYSFGVPISGCTVSKVEIKTEPPQSAAESPAVGVTDAAQSLTNDASVQKIQKIEKESSVGQKSVRVVQSSYVCVAKYTEVNGKRAVVSQKEYRGRNFKSPKEFSQFCKQELARVRAQGEANLRAVRNFGR